MDVPSRSVPSLEPGIPRSSLGGGNNTGTNNKAGHKTIKTTKATKTTKTTRAPRAARATMATKATKPATTTKNTRQVAKRQPGTKPPTSTSTLTSAPTPTPAPTPRTPLLSTPAAAAAAPAPRRGAPSNGRVCPECHTTISPKAYADHLKVHKIETDEHGVTAIRFCRNCSGKGRYCRVARNPWRRGLNTVRCLRCLRYHESCSFLMEARGMRPEPDWPHPGMVPLPPSAAADLSAQEATPPQEDADEGKPETDASDGVEDLEGDEL